MFFRLTFILALLASLPSLAAKPNVLFLFADDYTYEAVHALGHTDIDTPNLDRLMARGTTFSHAYNMGSWSGAVCVASRTMLITGRSVWSAHSIYNKTEKERQSGVLWPQLMKKAGYQTYMTGKWHIQTSAEKCFDVTRDVRAGMPKTVPQSYQRPILGQKDSWDPADPSIGGFWEGGKHWSEVVADHTLDFLKQADRAESPFFIYAAFNAPHDPRQSPQSYLDRYPLSRMKLPKSFLPTYPYRNDIGCPPSLRDENLAPMPRTEHSVLTHRREYYALITHLDDQIGRILDALDASQKAADTWIFFTADHGLAVGNHGFMGKQNLYDPSVRVPFIVAGPGVAAGARISTPIYLQDVMATALDLAGAERPNHLFYKSLLPQLKKSAAGQNTQNEHTPIYGCYLDLQRSITANGWKLIVYPKAKTMRLYDLKNDPSELTDLAQAPEQKARKQALFDQLVALSSSLEDKLDLKTALEDL